MKALFDKDNLKKPADKPDNKIVGQAVSEKYYTENKNTGLIICFRNGDGKKDPPLRVKSPRGSYRWYNHLVVYCDTNHRVFDDINGYHDTDFFGYLSSLKETNSNLNIDMSKTAGHIFSGKMTELFNELS